MSVKLTTSNLATHIYGHHCMLLAFCFIIYLKGDMLVASLYDNFFFVVSSVTSLLS